MEIWTKLLAITFYIIDKYMQVDNIKVIVYVSICTVLKTGIVSQAKGSAYIELGNTKVVCSVFDPREVSNKNGYCAQGEIYCEFKFAPFSCQKRKIHQQNAEEKQYSLILQRALEPAVCLVNICIYIISVLLII